LVSKPNFDKLTIVAVHMKKTELVFNKSVYLGKSILDISKTLMDITITSFHYNYMIKSEKCRLLMTDIDSLMCEISTSDFFQNILAGVS